MSFVSGYNASATGGSLNSVNFNAQALTGGVAAVTTTNSTITSSSMIADLIKSAGQTTAPTQFGQADKVTFSTGSGTAAKMTVVSIDSSWRYGHECLFGVGHYRKPDYVCQYSRHQRYLE